MGCISSKAVSQSVEAVSRSLSYHEGPNQSSRRAAKSLAALEDILISNKGNDQLLALVCTANTVANRLRSGSIDLEPITSLGSLEARINEIAADCDSSKGLMLREVHKDTESHCAERPKRSKSWHSFLSDETPSENMENCDGTKDGSEWEYRGAARSRSFHTVEEYDELLARIWSTSCSHENVDSMIDYEITLPKSSSEVADCNSPKLQASEKTLHRGGSSVEQNVASDEILKANDGPSALLASVLESNEMRTCSEEHSSSTSESTAKEGDVTVERCQTGKGLKRKAIAKGLESLAIPTTIEFPPVASLREWLPTGGGQEYSPRAYTTPKFGYYPLPKSKTHKEQIDDNYIFDAELVTAFEEHMQQLKSEEETILKQIAEAWEERGVKENPNEVAAS